MTIRAILRDGHILPLEPLPPDWVDGQELAVEDPDLFANAAQVDEWANDLDKAIAQIPLD